MDRIEFGVIGLSTMGANLARNAAMHGYRTIVFNRSTEKTKRFMEDYRKEGKFVSAYTVEDFCRSFQGRRMILLMVKAGEAVDSVLQELQPYLTAGDVVIDGGNSHFKDTLKREELLRKRGVRFIGMGISGGEEGALRGPSLMPGGAPEVLPHVVSVFSPLAAKDPKHRPCITAIGPSGSGHFVKMIHNGIEYGLMQLLAESYHILHGVLGLKNAKIADLFERWGKEPALSSFLIDCTINVLRTKDGDADKDLLDRVLDTASQKGTGRWTSEAALELGVSVPCITAAVDARVISAAKEVRMGRSKEIPPSLNRRTVRGSDLQKALHDALLSSFVSTYAQGFSVLTAARTANKWNIDLAEICRIWQGGCIIRSGLLSVAEKSYQGDADAAKVLRSLSLGKYQSGWRTVVSIAVDKGIPVPAFASGLTFLDSIRSAWLPANLISALRDAFGAHGFSRIDQSGSFHDAWNGRAVKTKKSAGKKKGKKR